MNNIDIQKIYGAEIETSASNLSSLKDSVNKLGKFAPFVLAAGAALPASAEVQCFDGPIVVGGGTFSSFATAPIDIDGDGTDDFVINQGTSFFGGPAAILTPTTTGNSFLATGGSSSPANLPMGSTVGSSASFTSFGTLYYSSFGNFTPLPSSGYVGVQFNSSIVGGTAYGWMEVEVAADGTVTIVSWGYDDEGNAILTGAECAPAEVPVPTMGEWGLITLMLLLLSFGTVLLFRRKEELDSNGEWAVKLDAPSNNVSFFKNFLKRK